MEYEESKYFFVSGMNGNNQLPLENVPAKDVVDFTKVTRFANTSVYKVACGYQNSLFLTEDNVLIQLGSYPNTFKLDDEIKTIKAGQNHFLALTTDGDVYSWLNNSDFELGHGDSSFRDKPTKIDSLKNVKKIYAGSDSSYFYFSNGDLYGCGYTLLTYTNLPWKRGEKPSLIQKNVKRFFTGIYSQQMLMIKDDNVLYVCGYNGYGHLGLGNHTTQKELKALPQFPGEEIINISCGYCHTLILMRKGEGQELYSAGYTKYTGLGNKGDVTNFELLLSYPDQQIQTMDSGSQFSLLKLKNNKILMFGLGSYGQFGQGNKEPIYVPVELKINEIKPYHNISIVCGSYSSFIKTKETKIEGLAQDLWNCYNSNEFCDEEFLSSDYKSCKFHRIILQARLKVSIEVIKNVLMDRSKQEIDIFMEWIYTGKVKDTLLLKEIFQQTEMDNFEQRIQDPKTDFLQNFHDLYFDENSKDFTIMVENRQIRAHKTILAARSELFKGMFLSVSDQSNQVHDYRNTPFYILEKLIQFFYTDRFDFNSFTTSEIDEIFELADFYQINPKSKIFKFKN
ncbi:regulator of chromosome condensation [Anaeramoeba ignava]|uniref:Regulator of chromosome condensation n=1 Tax=Anaeramoeba ignava TaxID=1746090 RepID=A0A9Q0RA55_ANAIG|nr:regulator of chromosome condensation [Anaeramoeba ignava]